MPKRFSSTQGWLGYALDLARKNRCEKAQEVLRKLTKRTFTSIDLRLAAQVNNRCGLLSQAEGCWLEIEKRGEMEPGDYYMLGSLQTQMLNLEHATRSFEREISIASEYFLDSAKIRLADLKLRLGDPLGAREVLMSISDGVGDYIDGIGYQSKASMLQIVDEELMR